jgi:hypothetical protein
MKKHISILLSALLTIALLSACGSNNNTPSNTPSDTPSGETPNVLSIQEQGNFSVGGTVVTSEGEFDPMQPWMVP